MTETTYCDDCPSCDRGRERRGVNDGISCPQCGHILCDEAPYYKEGWP